MLYIAEHYWAGIRVVLYVGVVAMLQYLQDPTVLAKFGAKDAIAAFVMGVIRMLIVKAQKEVKTQ